jgi:hypothetical protein|tara:strand:+ start:1727 stop:2401 length:675 start_codon:yes stop_codon:yes gene_type:complete
MQTKKMKTLSIILTLIFIQSVNGQNNVYELKSLLEKIERTDSIKQKIKTAHFKNLDVIEVFNELEREIDFGFIHHRMEIMHWKGELKLNFLSENGLIKYGWISDGKSTSKKKLAPEIFKGVPDFLSEYVSKHNNYYGSNLDAADFVEQMLTEYIVGFGCGFNGREISKESEATPRYSDNRNIKKLNKYLISFSPELQTLGAIGLFKIGELNKQQKKIINHLKSR